MDEKRPKPIYATSRNTESVRKGYELGGYLKNRYEIEEWDAAHKGKTCPAQAVNVAESSSPMPGLSPKLVPEDFLTRLDQKSDKLAELMIAMTGQMQAMAVNQKEMAELLSHIVQTLAEDQDPDEMPARYMDGKLV